MFAGGDQIAKRRSVLDRSSRLFIGGVLIEGFSRQLHERTNFEKPLRDGRIRKHDGVVELAQSVECSCRDAALVSKEMNATVVRPGFASLGISTNHGYRREGCARHIAVSSDRVYLADGKANSRARPAAALEGASRGERGEQSRCS